MSKKLIFRQFKTKFENNCIGFFQIGKLTIYKTLLPAARLGNINLHQQKVLLKTIYAFRIEISFIYGKIEIFDFKKTPFRYVFSIARNIFLRDCVGKGACIKRMSVVRNYSANTIMEKKTEEGG